MKLLSILAAGSLAAVAAPATAQHVRHVTTVSRVHGPLKILPHHKTKVCRVTVRHGVRDRKCHYN